MKWVWTLMLIFIEIDDFPFSINLFGVDNYISGVRRRASDFDSESVVKQHVCFLFFFANRFVFDVRHLINLLILRPYFTDTRDFILQFFCGESVAEL